MTRLGVGLGRGRRNEEVQTQKQEGTARGDTDTIARCVCCDGVSVVAKYILLPPHPYDQIDRQECD